MPNYMRNKKSGEIREVAPDSQEMRNLQATVDDFGRPAWEQTSDAHAAEILGRADDGSLRQQDVGQDNRTGPKVNNTASVGPEHEGWRELTEAEREAGLTREDKDQQLAEGLLDAQVAEQVDQTAEQAAEKIKSGGTERRPVILADETKDTPDETKDTQTDGGGTSKSTAEEVAV